MSLNKTNVEFLTHGHILEFPTYHTTTATPGRAHQTHPHRGGIEMKVEGFHTLNPLLHAEQSFIPAIFLTPECNPYDTSPTRQIEHKKSIPPMP